MSSIRDRVTGRTQFVADYPVPGYLHATFVRLRCPRARFRDLDTTEASKVEGVVLVLTAQDILATGPMPLFGPDVMDQPILAIDETRYEGEPIAVVLAETERASRAAAALVEVDYDELAPLMDRSTCLSAPPLHADRPPSQDEWADSNVMGSWTFETGDLAKEEARAQLVVENRYNVPFAHHFAMEVAATIAIPSVSGVEVITPIQHPFMLRRVLSHMLGLPLASVRVIGTELGGSFGSKGYPKLEPAAAYLALLVGRPVRVRLTAEEAFLLAQREAADIWIRTGFDEAGRVLFHEMDADFLVGAYTDISARVVSKTGLHALTPYRSEAVRVTARGLFSTTPPATAFRGFGAPHAVFALESQMDEAASKLGIDPVQLRLTNILEFGHDVPGEKPIDGDWAQLLKDTAEAIGWDDPKPEGRGRGIALGLKSCVPGTTSMARVVVQSDGSLGVYVGTTEMGQGTHATLAALAAEQLGVDVLRVTLYGADTALVPFDALTASSRSTVHMGNAVVSACDDIKQQCVALEVARTGETDCQFVDFSVVSGGVHRSVPEIMSSDFGPGVAELSGTGTFTGSKDSSHILNGPTPFYEVVATAVELEVDRETGRVLIHKIVHATDAGKILSPRRAEGLDDGGVVMGLGLALSENLLLDSESGRLLNGSSLDYRIPTICDIPAIQSRFQENHDGPGPHGSKGIAEGGVMAVAPAITAAIRDCTSYRSTELPVTPERILDGIEALRQ